MCVCNLRFRSKVALVEIIYSHACKFQEICCRALIAIRKRYNRERTNGRICGVSNNKPPCVGSHDVGKNCESVATRISKSKAVTHV